MGRLRLSVIGFAEPRLDKCNDLRLFCMLKIDEIIARRGKTEVCAMMNLAHHSDVVKKVASVNRSNFFRQY